MISACWNARSATGVSATSTSVAWLFRIGVVGLVGLDVHFGRNTLERAALVEVLSPVDAIKTGRAHGAFAGGVAVQWRRGLAATEGLGRRLMQGGLFFAILAGILYLIDPARVPVTL